MLSFLFGKPRKTKRSKKPAKIVKRRSKASGYLKAAVQNAPSILAAAGIIGSAVAASKNKEKIKEVFNTAVSSAQGNTDTLKKIVEKVIENRNVSPEQIKESLSAALAKVKSSQVATMAVASGAARAAQKRGLDAINAVTMALAERGITYEQALDNYKRAKEYVSSKIKRSEFRFGFGYRRRRSRRRMSKTRKPPARICKLCKKYKVKVTMKRGSKRVYKSLAVLKRQLRKKMKSRK